MRLQRRWPAELDRPGRNVKDSLLRDVRSQFRQPVGSVEDVALQLDAARADIAALERVLNNTAKKQYARPPELDALSEVKYDRRMLLSTDSQAILKKGVPWWARLLPSRIGGNSIPSSTTEKP